MINELIRVDTFSNRLSEAMNIRNMKQSDLAEQTLLSKQQLSQYTNGKFEVKVHALFILAQALSVSAEWLFGYDVPMERKKVKQMNQIMQIQNQEIQVKEFNGQRVVTFKDIDIVHCT